MTQVTRLVKIQPDKDFVQTIQSQGGENVRKCYQCGTCSAVCPISPPNAPFPRKEMLLAGWGLKDQLMNSPDIWLCHQCNDCSSRCPREATPGDVLAAIRKSAFEHYAVPQFLGKAVSSPKALLGLLLVPIILVSLILIKGQEYNQMLPESLRHMSWFGHYYPLLAVDTLFLGTVFIMGVLAITGLLRFWRNIGLAIPGKPTRGFIPATITTIREILTHSRFADCEQSAYRRLAHLLTFYGMIALFITTTIVFLGLYFGGLVFDHELHIPMSIASPVKWLGIAGGLSFCIGLFLLFNARLNHPDNSGKTTYKDLLFLIVLLVVGLSGGASYLLRIASPDSTVPVDSPITTAALVVYFLHLVSVWFLLAYLPYSKFAHIFYRTFALIRAHMVQRWS